MNQEVKAKWLTALRSGEYAQGRGALRRGNEFCCLGVLCDLAVKADVIPAPEHPTPSDPDYLYDVASQAILPRRVMSWAGLDSTAGTRGDGRTALTELNDIGTPFSEIADIIERDF